MNNRIPNSIQNYSTLILLKSRHNFKKKSLRKKELCKKGRRRPTSSLYANKFSATIYSSNGGVRDGAREKNRVDFQKREHQRVHLVYTGLMAHDAAAEFWRSAPSQCPEIILNKIEKTFNKTYTGLKSFLQRFQICFFSKSQLKGHGIHSWVAVSNRPNPGQSTVLSSWWISRPYSQDFEKN